MLAVLRTIAHGMDACMLAIAFMLLNQDQDCKCNTAHGSKAAHRQAVVSVALSKKQTAPLKCTI